MFLNPAIRINVFFVKFEYISVIKETSMFHIFQTLYLPIRPCVHLKDGKLINLSSACHRLNLNGPELGNFDRKCQVSEGYDQ